MGLIHPSRSWRNFHFPGFFPLLSGGKIPQIPSCKTMGNFQPVISQAQPVSSSVTYRSVLPRSIVIKTSYMTLHSIICRAAAGGRGGSQSGRQETHQGEERQKGRQEGGGGGQRAHCRRARQNVAHALSATSGNRNQYHVAAHSPPSPLPPLTHSHFSLPAPLSSLPSPRPPLPLFPACQHRTLHTCHPLVTPHRGITASQPSIPSHVDDLPCHRAGGNTPQPHLPYTRVPPVLLNLPEMGYPPLG